MPEAMKAHLEGMRRRRLEREANPPPPILGLRLLTREQGEEVDRQVEEIRARKAALRAQREAAEAAAASATGEAGKDPTRAIG